MLKLERSQPLRAAVIGAGSMGRQHMRVYQTLEDVELVAVADSSEEALRRATRGLALQGYQDYREMLDREALDVVSVVVPTSGHREVALEVIGHGVALLVEKPIAGSYEEAIEIIDAADAAGITLAVGYIERFNPAVRELERQLAVGALGKLYQIKAVRVGPFPVRIQDVGVAIDLATHDLDLMLKLVGAAVERVSAESTSRVCGQHEDLLSAILRFADGTVGALDVNWVTPRKVRQLSVVGERGMFALDYLTQELVFYERGAIGDGWDYLSMFGAASQGAVLGIRTQNVEPLYAELSSLVTCVRERREAEVTGRDGLRALALAEAILDAAKAGQALRPRITAEACGAPRVGALPEV